MGTGGRPGVTLVGAVIVEPHDGKIIVIPKHGLSSEDVEYLQQRAEFTVQFTPHAGNGGGDNGNSENEGNS